MGGHLLRKPWLGARCNAMSALHKEAYEHLADAVELWLTYARDKSCSQRNLLFEFYEPWVRKMTNSLFKRYYCPQLEWGDYYSQCSLGTIQAIEKYNPTMEIPFEGFAYKYVKGKVLDEIKKLGIAICQKNIGVQERSLSLKSDKADIFESVVDTIVGLAFGQLLEFVGAGADDGLNQTSNYYYCNRCEQEFIDEVLISSLVERLTQEQNTVVKYHYFQQMKFNDIAEILQVSKARVSQIHKQAIETIRVLYEESN